MSKKFLSFQQHDENWPSDFTVCGANDVWVGDISEGEMFPNRVAFFPADFTEWTSECLRQVADKLDDIERQRREEVD